jgi:hypothetical protein
MSRWLPVSTFVVLIAIPDLTAAQVAPSAPDPFRPTAAECQIVPRSRDELRTLLANNPPATPDATPGDARELPRAELPAGMPADDATIAAVTDVARQRHACVNAGDLVRYLSLFSDRMIRSDEGLRRLVDAVASDDFSLTPMPRAPSQWFTFDRLDHVRVVTDGRVTAVGFADFLGVPEVYLFVRAGERWLIDEITPNLDPSAANGVIGNTFTGVRRQFDRKRGLGGFSYGVE